ncbi:MAG: hypothetical protein JXB47_14680 [Anaerolineae bacterium]|nr:hypothetical protein [Anaerolineae bacterium]
MSTNANTWFYSEPEPDAYLIEERVNQSLWNARLYALYLDCTSAESPFRMVGEWQGRPVEIEWEVGKVFTLRTQEEMPDLRRGFSLVLGIQPPSVAYQDVDGAHVTEWYVDGGEDRWREIQGQARFRHPKRRPQ